MKKAIYRLIGLAVLLGLGWGAYRYFKQGGQKVSAIATAKVQRGDVVIRAFTRGELKAVRVYPLYAPNLNGTVQVTQLAPMGSLAREKNLVVEYDDSELLGTIDSDKLTVDSTDEQIVAAKLNMDITRSQDQVKLLTAKYNVKRGDLNVQQCPVIDVIDCKTYKLQQEQSVRTLAQQQIDVQMLEAQLASQLAVLQDTRRRSAQLLAIDMQRLATVKTLAPMQGLVAIKQNRGGSFNFGMQMPDIRQGDQLQAGLNVADLLDLSEMELTAKVGEMDRANLSEGQPMTFQLDSIPDKRFPGKIKTLSGTATSDVFSGDPSKKFDVTFSVDMRALLGGVGEKPDAVERIMNTAAENAKKNLVSFAPTGGGGGRGGGGGPDMGGGPGGPGGGPGGFPGGFDPSMLAAINAAGRGGPGGGGQGGGQGAQGGGGGQGRGGFGANLSDEDRQKLADIRQKMQNATGDERDKLQQQMQEIMQRAGGGRGRGGDMAGGQAGGQGRGQGGGQGGGQARQFGAMAGVPQFTDDDRTNAKLPPPPEQDSDISLLLRPGLLADVEIDVETIPNALHVPKQAVIQKSGQPTMVYVQEANGKWTPRVVKVLKQSESMMVLESGVQAGEMVALSDPTASKSEKNKTEEKKSTSATSMIPGGK